MNLPSAPSQAQTHELRPGTPATEAREQNYCWWPQCVSVCLRIKNHPSEDRLFYLNKSNTHPVLSAPIPWLLELSIKPLNCSHRLLQVYGPDWQGMCGQAVCRAPPKAFQGSYLYIPAQEKIYFRDFFFPICHSSENIVYSPSYCMPREGDTEAVAAFSCLCTPDSIFFLPNDNSFITLFLSFPLSSLWTGCYYLLPSLILVPPSPHPHIHAITIALLITSIVRE